MPLITFQPANVTVRVDPGMELLDAAREAGVELDAPCGGKGTCGNCTVQIRSGRVVSESSGILSPPEVAAGLVLACRSSIGEVDVTVEVRDRPASIDGQFDEEMGMGLVDPALLPRHDDLCPLTQKVFIRVPPPRKADGLSDLDRLTRELQKGLGVGKIVYSLSAVRQIADALRIRKGEATVTIAVENSVTHAPPGVEAVEVPPSGAPQPQGGNIRVTAVEAGDTTSRHLGMAIDIGTTTVAVQLVDLSDGAILGSCTDYNGQIACGLDVISRIDYARRPDRRDELRNRILRTINRLIRRTADSGRIESRDISGAVIAGNTTMIHLLLGLNPEYIRLDPFTPTLLAPPPLTAGEIGIDLHPPAPVMISPAVGSYVGGDITAGLLCTDLSREGVEVCLFMDIGTNGEVVLGNGEFLLTAACSAGPAFEGAGIKCGMRAAVGAVEGVEIDPETAAATCRTIGRERPRGICGSGMISLLAQLLKTGWVDAAGKLNRSRSSESIRIDGRRASFTLVPAPQSATGAAITIDEQEIENIIRAKAAMYAACALLLAEVGMDFGDLGKIYIAGGFGRFLDLDAAVAIGLLPNLPRERYRFLGNASLKGSIMALISTGHRRKLDDLARRMTYLELNTAPAYMDQYTAALFLPHTDAAPFLGSPVVF